MKRKLKRTTAIFIMAIMVVSSLTMAAYATEDMDSPGVSKMRNMACTRMKEMSEVKWTLTSDISYYKKATDKDPIKLYASNSNGKITYYGIPYSQIFRESSLTPNYPDYTINSGTKNGKFSLKGVDCSSSVAYSWRMANRKFVPNQYDDETFMKMTLKGSSTKSIYTTQAMLKDATCKTSTDFVTSKGNTYTTGTFISLVGNYGNYAAASSKADFTSDLINNADYPAGQDINSAVYSKIRPGDAIIRRIKSSDNTIISHIQMVVKVDPDAGKVYCIDQYGTYTGSKTNPNDFSCWRNEEYTFTKLKDLNYIPIKMNKIDNI